MKKLTLFLIIFFSPVLLCAAEPVPTPDYVDVYDVPKESLINPYHAYNSCTGNLDWIDDWNVMVFVNCPHGEMVVSDFQIRYLRYGTDGKIRLKILWYQYEADGELVLFKFNEATKNFERK